MTSWFRRYLLPGLVFQSICIAGGYGAMTWVFIGIIVVPLLTIGVWKVSR